MRDAFESRPEDEKCPFDGIQEQEILAAAQHILWDGQDLFNHVLSPQRLSPEAMQGWHPGPLYTGDHSLSLDRWRFWRTGFLGAAGTAGFGGECRDVAARAARMMEAFEQNLLF
jgi:hypothetical protein